MPVPPQLQDAPLKRPGAGKLALFVVAACAMALGLRGSAGAGSDAGSDAGTKVPALHQSLHQSLRQPFAQPRWASPERRDFSPTSERRDFSPTSERRDFSPGVTSVQPAPPPGVAFFVRALTNPRDRREAYGAILDTPVLPGSIVKAVTLVAALEAGVIGPASGAMCRRVVTVDGVRFVCAHPDLRRPLTPAEALAHSCNDFFVSLARQLPRDRVNRTRVAAGLPPLAASAALGPALVGLDGPRVTPRALIDVLSRLTGVGPDPPVPMSPSTRAVLIEGLTGAATFGTASALGARGVSAWAKTGTAPMPGGGVAGLVVALAPAGRPTHGVVVV
ncbi:MAG: hypothetical protein IT180_15780, partial [Acidobacteria bacterium]|nr:hypothetical protein [Acidobacteriota bacterium]